MKIRNPRLVAAAGWLATRAAGLLFRTLDVEYRPLGPDCFPGRLRPGERFIYCIWHENLLLPAVSFACPNIAVLISQHADGQLLGSLIRSLDMGMVRGSTTRGGVRAVRELVRGDTSWRHLAITPDGPRGPRRVVQPGLVYVASRTGMRVVPVGVGYRKPWRAGSWDRFAVPKPFSRGRCVSGTPITVPDGLRADQLEPFRLRIQAEMDRLNALAEGWAETGEPAVPVEVANAASPAAVPVP